jgi:hypothetical protein
VSSGHGPRTAEHVAAQNPGADVLESARGEIVVEAGLALVLAEQGALERAGRDEPFVQRHAADAERILQVLPGTGAVAVERDGKGVNADFAHAGNLGGFHRRASGSNPLLYRRA